MSENLILGVTLLPHHFSHLLLRLWFLWPEDAGVRNKRTKNRCGCLGGCRFFGGTNMGQDFFKLEELTPSSSSAFSCSSTESDMFYGQSLLHPGECIITKEMPKVDGMDLLVANYMKDIDKHNVLICEWVCLVFCPKGFVWDKLNYVNHNILSLLFLSYLWDVFWFEEQIVSVFLRESCWIENRHALAMSASWAAWETWSAAPQSPGAPSLPQLSLFLRRK